MTTQALQANMADACEDARNLLLIALTVFQTIIPVFIRRVVAQKKICDTKNPVRLPHLWKSENHAARNRFHLRNGLRKQKKTSFEHSRRRSPGGTDFVDIFKTESYRDRRDCPLKSSWIASCEVHQRQGSMRFAKYLLWITKLKTNFQLPIIGFCRKFSTLVSECALSTDKVNKKAAIFVTFCGLDENAGGFSSRKGHSRAIDNRTFPGWTAIGLTRLHVFRENSLLLYYFRGYGGRRLKITSIPTLKNTMITGKALGKVKQFITKKS